MDWFLLVVQDMSTSKHKDIHEHLTCSPKPRDSSAQIVIHASALIGLQPAWPRSLQGWKILAEIWPMEELRSYFGCHTERH